MRYRVVTLCWLVSLNQSSHLISSLWHSGFIYHTIYPVRPDQPALSTANPSNITSSSSCLGIEQPCLSQAKGNLPIRADLSAAAAGKWRTMTQLIDFCWYWLFFFFFLLNIIMFQFLCGMLSSNYVVFLCPVFKSHLINLWHFNWPRFNYIVKIMVLIWSNWSIFMQGSRV